jgi:hypothetical protein
MISELSSNLTTCFRDSLKPNHKNQSFPQKFYIQYVMWMWRHNYRTSMCLKRTIKYKGTTILQIESNITYSKYKAVAHMARHWTETDQSTKYWLLSNVVTNYQETGWMQSQFGAPKQWFITLPTLLFNVFTQDWTTDQGKCADTSTVMEFDVLLGKMTHKCHNLLEEDLRTHAQ